jgi:DNA-binding NarL/FixJ family response regulator
LLPELRTIAGRLDVDGGLQEAWSLTFAAEAARVSGAPDRGAWDAAVTAWATLRQPYTEARALLGAARAAVAEGDRDEAARHLTRAAELADQVGAPPLAAEIGALAKRARIPVAGEPSSGGARLGLTAREHEVLRLVADGRSNREIAGELFISAKTASVHVSNILAKLGVASRGEAAAMAHQQNLFD